MNALVECRALRHGGQERGPGPVGRSAGLAAFTRGHMLPNFVLHVGPKVTL